MIVVTTETIPGKRVKTLLGIARGNTIRARHMGHDILAGFKNMVGGEITGYTKMMAEAREQAIDRMIEDAESLGANAVIAMRITTTMVMTSAAEFLVYGTAVIVEDDTN